MTMTTDQFVNEAKPVTPKYPGYYGFDRAPKLLFCWSRMFQAVVSQAGTYLLTGKFHDRECGIYKCEGGCNISGVGEAVLTPRGVYLDGWRDDKAKAARLAEMVTRIVLGWNPLDPVNSMLAAAASACGVSVEVMRAGTEKSRVGGVFGGNALSSFFDWNPFSEPPIDRDYERYCLVTFNGYTHAQVDQKYADIDLGRSYLQQINAAIRERNPGLYGFALCCSPNRKGDKVSFWINTGRSTQLDGWKSEADIKRFLASGERLKDTAKW